MRMGMGSRKRMKMSMEIRMRKSTVASVLSCSSAFSKPRANISLASWG